MDSDERLEHLIKLTIELRVVHIDGVPVTESVADRFAERLVERALEDRLGVSLVDEMQADLVSIRLGG